MKKEKKEKPACPLENVTIKEEKVIGAIVKGKPWYCTNPQHPKFMNKIEVSKCMKRNCRWLRRTW